MPKEIVQMTIERGNPNEPWGFIIIGGKDQSLTVKVGKVKPYSLAEKAGLKPFDYIWQINGKEVFEMSHNECVQAIKNSGTRLELNTERYGFIRISTTFFQFDQNKKRSSLSWLSKQSIIINIYCALSK